MAEKGIISKLSQISLFDDVPEHDLAEIASITTEHFYKPLEIVIEENSTADAFFIIYSGKIEILKKFDDGEEIILGVYSNGEFFGEMSILDEGPRSATARAVQPTELLQVSYEDFERVLAFAPQIAYAIMKELSLRLRQTGALLVWKLNRKNKELEEASFETVRSVVNIFEDRASFLNEHSTQVAELSINIGRKMNLSNQEIKYLELGGLLHDIGMIGMDQTIISKNGPLNEDERRLLEKHTIKSSEILSHIKDLKPVVPYVLYHHERFDGSGYPEHLSKESIPLGSRIIAVAEVFNALTNDRPYRTKLNIKEATSLLKDKSGKEFDPDVVKALIAVLKNSKH